ncbi:MAG: histidine phosphatase family protein [Bernardetiaceae bacterium]|nr:histidine phosphatase family protein [Bernardetiaceae bacterium]
MKTLILLRHAKSSWKEDLPDIERPLNKRGKRNAPFMAKRLRSVQGLQRHSLLVLSSPALRARLTAEIFAGHLAIPKIQIEEDLYFQGTEAMREVVRAQSDHFQTILLVAHNPDLNDWIDEIGKQTLDNLPTCAYYALEAPITYWAEWEDEKAVFSYWDYPKRYKNQTDLL